MQNINECLNSQIYFGQIGYVIKKSKVKALDDDGEFEVETFFDSLLEKESIIWMESQVNHSEEILQCFRKAYIAAKKTRRHRLFSLMGTEIAREHLRNQNFEVAKPLYDTLIEEYRKENWNAILFSIMNDALECAIKLNLEKDIISYCMNILQGRILCYMSMLIV